jgi:hypothetical protein
MASLHDGRNLEEMAGGTATRVGWERDAWEMDAGERRNVFGSIHCRSRAERRNRFW